MSRVAIMSGGTLPEEDSFFASIFPDYPFHVAVDMGMNVFHRLNKKPDVLIGDLDSICPKIQIDDIKLHQFPRDKDKSDTELAIDFCIEEGWEYIDILGGIGDRLDHTLANAYLLTYAHKRCKQIRLRNAQNTIYLLNGENALSLYGNIGDTISIIPITSELQKLNIRGCRWDVTDTKIQRGQSRGLSNYLTNNHAHISAENGMAFVFHLHQK